MLRTRKLLLILCLAVMQNVQAQVIHIKDSGQEQGDAVALYQTKEAPQPKLKAIPVKDIKLKNSLFTERYGLNVNYVMSLSSDKLMQNFFIEAGSPKNANIGIGKDGNLEDFHWGWESPSVQLRGHFLGHWLSAAAYIYAETGNEAVKVKADGIIDDLELCQQYNGGEWLGSIPEKYLYLLAEGKSVWSPQYTLHKTLMGLYDMYTMAGSEKALRLLDKFADWFHRWVTGLDKDGKSDVTYWGESCGMLEIWANMYGLTHEQKYLDLARHYGQPYMFQELMKGEDALSMNHANASIPWSHGAARLYEVTGQDYWRQVVERFWKCAVDDRESFCTGGQNAGEHWIPAHKLAEFCGENNQEHCTVYNMIRTADFLYRWSGDQKYADYIERNIYNGLLAQQHPQTGMVAYFLPMAAGYSKGGEKGWGHPTRDFYCCHGSLVQAQTRYLEYIYFESDDGLTVSQYIPSTLQWQHDGANIKIDQDFAAHEYGKLYAGNRWTIKIKVNADRPTQFDLALRLPWWLKQKAQITVNGERQTVGTLHGEHSISRTWQNDEVVVSFPYEIYAEPLPGRSDMVAFMEGPLVLAAQTDNEVTLHGNPQKPETMFMPEYDQEYKTIRWKQSHYRTVGQEQNLRLVPLYEIGDGKYEIYFPISKK